MTNIGFIGCGKVVETRHLPALHHLEEANVVALADVDPSRLDRIGRITGAEHRYQDYHRLLDNPNVEVVSICTPVGLHAKFCIAALKANKHVLIEKPMALDLGECDAMINQARASDCHVMVGFNMRWHRLMQQARRWVETGRLGRIKAIRSSFSSKFHGDEPGWTNRRQSGGGILVEMAIHHFDLWRFLLQHDIEHVYARSQSGAWQDESAVVAAQMSDGVLAEGTFVKGTGESNEIRIYGEQGILNVSAYRFDGIRFTPAAANPGKVTNRIQDVVQTITMLPGGLPTIRRGGGYLESFHNEWQHFLKCVRTDRHPAVSLEDSRQSTADLLAVLHSADSGMVTKPDRCSPA